MNKKIITAAVIAAMAMLTACGESAPAETEAVTATASETSAETEAGVTEDTVTEAAAETETSVVTDEAFWTDNIIKNDNNISSAEDIKAILFTDTSVECAYGYIKDNGNYLMKITQDGTVTELMHYDSDYYYDEADCKSHLNYELLNGSVPIIRIGFLGRCNIYTLVTIKDNVVHEIAADVDEFGGFTDGANSGEYDILYGDELFSTTGVFDPETCDYKHTGELFTPGSEGVSEEQSAKTVQYIVVEPSQENIKNAVLELDPAYDTEKLDAFLNAQYDEENSEDVPWFLSKVQCAVKDDTSGSLYIINYTQTGTLLKICNMTNDSVVTTSLAPELLSITITSDADATYLNVASDRGNLIGGYVFDLTNEKVLVDTFARDTEEGVTDEMVYPEEYLKYADLNTEAVLITSSDTSVESTDNAAKETELSAESATCSWENIVYDTAYRMTVDNSEQHVYTESYHFSDDNLETEFSAKVKNADILQYFKDNSRMFAELCDYDGPSGCYVAVTEHDLDNDGEEEMLINVNYGIVGTVGCTGDFAIVDNNVVEYWSKTDDLFTVINRQNMGMYFTEDPVKTIGFNDVAKFTSIASYDFSVNSDNCFIGCEISNNSVINYYYQVTFDDGVYDLNCVKASGWVAHWNDDEGVYYRNTDIDYLD